MSSAVSFPVLFKLQRDVFTKWKYTLGVTARTMTGKTRLHCCDDPAKIKLVCDEKRSGRIRSISNQYVNHEGGLNSLNKADVTGD